MATALTDLEVVWPLLEPILAQALKQYAPQVLSSVVGVVDFLGKVTESIALKLKADAKQFMAIAIQISSRVVDELENNKLINSDLAVYVRTHFAEAGFLISTLEDWIIMRSEPVGCCGKRKVIKVPVEATASTASVPTASTTTETKADTPVTQDQPVSVVPPSVNAPTATTPIVELTPTEIVTPAVPAT